MTKREALQLFEEKKIRSVWDDKEEKWYFSIVDVCAVLTESKDPTAYWRTTTLLLSCFFFSCFHIVFLRYFICCSDLGYKDNAFIIDT